EFLATLAHELRNPLAPLRSSVDLLRGAGSAAPDAVIDIVERQVEHLVRLANDLYETSRIRRGPYELRWQRGPLGRRRGGAAEQAVIDIVARQVEPLVRLANDLYEPSRIRLGTYEMRRQRVALGDVLDDAIETTRALIARSGHELETSLPTEELWLDGDPM